MLIMFFLQKALFIIKCICIFRLVLRCLVVARKENLTGFSSGLTGRLKNLDPTGFHHRFSPNSAKPFRKGNLKTQAFKRVLDLNLSMSGAERARQFNSFNDF